MCEVDKQILPCTFDLSIFRDIIALELRERIQRNGRVFCEKLAETANA